MARPPEDLDEEATNVVGTTKPEPAKPPPIEIVLSRDEVVLSARDAGLASQRYRMLEVWTRNRVYIVDSALECIEVTDRRSGTAEVSHSLVGAKLAGGQRKYAKTMHISRPFPVPGTEAIFVREGKKNAPAGLTSKVERVVLHIHIASVAMTDGAEAWDDVTSHLLQHKFGLDR
jgi:hypothetical protein